MESIISGILVSAVTSGAVIIIAAIGEILNEQAGVLNLGLEGIMAMGAVTAIIVVNGITPNAYLGLLAASLVGVLMGAIFAFGTVTFKANQVLCGLAYTFLGIGLAGQIGGSVAGQPAMARFEQIRLPFLSTIPGVGDILFNHNILVYFAYLLLPAVSTYILFITRHGINIRAVGENPAAADASGVPVDRIRFFYTSVGGALAGMAGAYLTLGLTPAWTEGVTGGRGWIAIALVIFSGWKPFYVLIGALLFGAITSIGYMAQIHGWSIPSSFLAMLPYLATILLMVVPILVRGGDQHKRLVIGPSASGQPYYRE